MRSAWEELQAERQRGSMPFLCPSLGEFFRSRGTLEIYGSSSVGKSTLAMQFMIQHLRHRTGSKALYLCTDNQFSIQRLGDLCSNLGEAAYAGLLERIIVQHLGDLDTQDHFVNYFLEPLTAQEHVGCIIVDTVTANYRVEQRSPQVTASLYSMAQRLNSISCSYNVAVISLNQVTDDFSGDGVVKPALGLSWSNSVSSRAFLKRHASGSSRIFVVERSPSTPSICVELSLGKLGFEKLQEIKQIA